MTIEKLIQREKEIIRELNQGNTDNLQEALGIARSLYDMYEPYVCGFISKHKETGLCKECGG